MGRWGKDYPQETQSGVDVAERERLLANVAVNGGCRLMRSILQYYDTSVYTIWSIG